MARRSMSVDREVADLIARIERRFGKLSFLSGRLLHEPGEDADPDELAEERQARLLHPPASEAAVAAAETKLGFPLPPLLRAVYTRIGNGGWCVRLMGVEGGQAGFDDNGFRKKTIVAARRHMVKNWPKLFGDPWPEFLVPISDGSGCGMIEHVDCSADDGKVWRTDSGYLTELYPTLGDYLRQAVAAAAAPGTYPGGDNEVT